MVGVRKSKETPKELVRQRIVRALFHEYGISVEGMAADFPVLVGGRRRRVDIAIFAAGEAHLPENIQRAVVCRPEPKQNKRGAVMMRDYEQAAQDIADVKPFFEEVAACRYALWTNGLEFFFLRKKATKSQVDAEPIGDWPPADEFIGDRSVLCRARTRRADPEMLRPAFRRCHNFIHGNEGMPKDAAFRQFLYLIFCKMHDERTRRDRREGGIRPSRQYAVQAFRRGRGDHQGRGSPRDHHRERTQGDAHPQAQDAHSRQRFARDREAVSGLSAGTPGARCMRSRRGAT